MTQILIEDSLVPIYRRVAHALRSALVRQGLEVEVVSPWQHDDTSSLLSLLDKHASATYLSTNVCNAIQRRMADDEGYLFERFAGRLVFLHLDSLLSDEANESALELRLRAFQRVGARSTHLCIEADNVATLRTLGIAHAEFVQHASEIDAREPTTDAPSYSVSFVGHIVPWCEPIFSGDPVLIRRLLGLLSRRRADFAQPLGPAMATAAVALNPCTLEREVANMLVLRSLVNVVSTAFRGSVLDAAKLPSVDVFGGDPAYMHGATMDRRLSTPGVTYHAPVFDLEALTHVYRSSGVSLNISSPQFDYAVPNRFHDVVMSGGLCLTDRRAGLRDLTEYHEQVSYASVDELRDKVEYFTHASHRQLRARLIRALQRDVVSRSGYPLLAARIAEAVSRTAELPRAIAPLECHAPS